MELGRTLRGELEQASAGITCVDLVENNFLQTHIWFARTPKISFWPILMINNLHNYSTKNCFLNWCYMCKDDETDEHLLVPCTNEHDGQWLSPNE